MNDRTRRLHLVILLAAFIPITALDAAVANGCAAPGPNALENAVFGRPQVMTDGRIVPPFDAVFIGTVDRIREPIREFFPQPGGSVVVKSSTPVDINVEAMLNGEAASVITVMNIGERSRDGHWQESALAFDYKLKGRYFVTARRQSGGTYMAGLCDPTHAVDIREATRLARLAGVSLNVPPAERLLLVDPPRTAPFVVVPIALAAIAGIAALRRRRSSPEG